ncbi:MAG: ComF family protein [Cohaesibacter sp.]|nr:ComF family protein [Cohaesibacter sp.]
MTAEKADSGLLSIIQRRLRGAFSLMAAFLWPPVCANCGRAICDSNHLCGGCWQEMHWVDRPFCPVSGVPYPYDAGQDIVSPAVLADPPAYDKARCVALYDATARALVHKLKYYDRTDLAVSMGDWMVRAGADFFANISGPLVVVPVPLHRRRLIGRRYNQAALLAKAIADQKGLAYWPDCLVRRRATRQQVGLSDQEREANVRGAFRLNETYRHNISGKSIVLIDDVMTTGATIEACARALRRAWAAQIFVIVFARVVESGQMTI